MSLPKKSPPAGLVNILTTSLFAFLLNGCSSTGADKAPPEKERMQLQISISADDDLNSDVKGRGAPVLLRIYELRSATVFQEADFFDLQDHDKTTLATDLLAVDQFILRPGETRKIRRDAQTGSTAIGVLAAYRDLPNAKWRVIHTMVDAPDAHWYRALVSAKATRLNIQLQARAVALTDLDVKPAKAAPAQAFEPAKGLKDFKNLTAN